MSLTTNLVSYWKLDESSGNASDSVGSNTLTNNNGVTYSAGKLGNGANFVDASSQSLSATALSLVTNAWTFGGWFNPSATDTSNKTFFSYAPTSGSINKIQIEGLVSGNIRCLAFNSSGTLCKDYRTTVNLSASVWSHVAMTWDGSTLKVYINGIESGVTKVTDTSLTNTNTSRSFALGQEVSSTNYWNGSIDEVGVWSRALTADEVSQLYNSNRALAYPLTAPTLYGGVAYYKLDESSGNASDSIGTKTLTNNNSATYSAGKINNGVNLASASSQYLRNASVSGYTSWSVSFWFKPTTNQDQIPVTLDDVGSNRIFQFFFNATQVNVSGWTSGGTQKNTSLTNHGMSTGTWYFWTATWDSAGNLTLYKNGSSIASVATTGNNKATSSTFNIGRAEDSTYYTNGSIDEVGYWSRALTSTEVTTLYNLGNGLQYPWTGLSTSNFFMFF